MGQDLSDMRKNIQQRLYALRGRLDIAAIQRRLGELEQITSDPDFWLDQKRTMMVLKEKSDLERKNHSFLHLKDEFEDAETLWELGQEESDLEVLEESKEKFFSLGDELRKVEIQLLLSEEADENSAILEINSGAGGTDASDWAEMLKRMYLFWCNDQGYKTILLEEHSHEEAGIKSCSIEVQGLYAYGYLKSEIGVHRLVRISPFDSNSRRHTAFASVSVTPDIDDSIEIDIVDSDLRIDTYRASGAGGQHVNTTDSAVRITHLPTGLVVTCQNERSQHKNKDRAMKMLRGKLYQYELAKRQEQIDASQAMKKKIEWGSQIRNYVLHPYKLVKDMRTGYESSNVEKVLSGALSPFMEAWLALDSDSGEEE
ncbi:MAG: peptide chain release factor 2 [Myxococcota bacterium]|nr:peptide chain release factor 2 [Myxococcota bacterium]